MDDKKKNITSIESWKNETPNKGFFAYKGNKKPLPADKLDKYSQQSISEPFKGTELEGTANAIDKATGWLDKKMAGWAGKNATGESN